MSCDITVVIPSCNRPRLLEGTLNCLVPHVRRGGSAVMIGENVALSQRIREVVGAFAARCPEAVVELVDLTQAVTASSPKRRMIEAVDLLYDRVDTPYVFHCEDDWWLSAEDFLTPSKAILEQFPEVKIVRLTGREARPFPEHERLFAARCGTGSVIDFWLSKYGGAGGCYGAFTFNPGLRRSSDRSEHFGVYSRFENEASISRFAQELGHREAILKTVFARHMGVGLTTQRGLAPPVRPSGATRTKVFGIGMFKTGTTSFGEAMHHLGYRSRYRFLPLLDNLAGYFDLDPTQFLRFEAQIRSQAESFDAFADSPWLYLYRQLDHWYPDARFVLTVRKDAETVARSDLQHWERHGLLDHWMKEVGTPPTRQMFVDRYERHNDNVVSFFRDKSHRILQVCWEEESNPWRKLCEFVGADVPDRPFPHANRSPDQARVAS